MASYTPAALLAQVAEGLPFDITDAIASFIFGLAFAPELARLLARVRARMEVRWAPPAREGATLLVLLFALGSLGAHAGRPASASAEPAQALAAGVQSGLTPELSFLGRAQNADGGFGEGAGSKSSELYSAWAAMGMAAAGEDPLGVRRDGSSVLVALRREAGTLEDVGDIERTILALHACGVQARTLGSLDLEAKLLAARQRDGSFAGQVNLTAFGIFALRAEGRTASDGTVQAAARWLAGQQEADGGFGFDTRGSGSEVDDTGAAVQALETAGARQHAAIARAVSYLTHAQNADGGFPEGAGSQSNAQSTAWGVQGLVAAGRDVDALRRGGGRSPLGYLRSLVAPNGSVRYSRTSAQTPVWVTAQALIALARKPFPIAPVRAHRTALGAASAAPSAMDARSGAPTGAAGAATANPSRQGRGASTPVHAVVAREDTAALGAVLSTVEGGLKSVARRALTPIGVS